MSGKVMGYAPAYGAGTIELLIDEPLEVADQSKNAKAGLAGEAGNLKTVQRVSRLIDTMTGANDNIEIRTHENLIFGLPAAGYGTTEFDMEPNRLKHLSMLVMLLCNHLTGKNQQKAVKNYSGLHCLDQFLPKLRKNQ